MRLTLPGKNLYRGRWCDEELDLLKRLVYHPVYGFLYRYRYKMILPFISKCEVMLEVGCGHGLLLPSLIKNAGELYALDAHPYLNRVSEIVSKAVCGKVAFSRGSILDLPFKDRSFECVVCVSVLEHITEIEKAAYELWRILKRNGRLVVGFPVKNRITRLLFKLIGRDDRFIHPQDHLSIISALNKRLKARSSKVFPPLVPRPLTFYYTGEYVRDD